mmetsp:Transcript_34404/g.91093  ORF Transcript_34404/g.91093 Transcript_34404/m.91093 type:complete len:94 (+) Transcript_34404:2796-3077(+)
MDVERDSVSGVVTVTEAYRDTFAPGPILSLALAVDGYSALLFCADEGLHYWDVRDRHLKGTYQGHSAGRYVIKPAFGGHAQSLVASGSQDCSV